MSMFIYNKQSSLYLLKLYILSSFIHVGATFNYQLSKSAIKIEDSLAQFSKYVPSN